jgi:hypothetical protein
MLPLWTQRETAGFLRLSERDLERKRISGTGPKYLRLGKNKAVRYRPADVESWVESLVVTSTSEEQAQHHDDAA